MRPELRLLRLVGPYRGLLALGLLTTFLASLLDGFTLVILIPLLKHLFGTTGQLRAGSTQLEAFVARVTEPLVAGLTPGQAAGRLVVVLVLGLLLKNVLRYASSQISVGVQEGLVRDLRTRIFDHLLTLDLGYFQRTRAGQLISGIITEVDQTKTVITASLLSLFQNLVVVATTLVVLSQISAPAHRCSRSRACPLMVLLLQALLKRLRRHSRARARERGEVTATITERIGAVRLIRAYGEEARESARFAAQATRYRKQVDPDPALLVADQPAHRGVLGVPGDPHHLGRQPARAHRPRRAARARGDHRVSDGGAQAHLAAQDHQLVPRGHGGDPRERGAGVRDPRRAQHRGGPSRRGRGAVRAGDRRSTSVTFRYGSGRPGPERRVVHAAQGQGGGAGRAVRGGEDHAGRPAAAVSRSRPAADH